MQNHVRAATKMLASGVVATALIAMFATPAWASTWSFQFDPQGQGWMSGQGDVQWDSKIQFDHDAWLYDYCGAGGQGDGFGVAVTPVINTPSSVSFTPEWRNSAGCGTARHFEQLNRRVGGQNVQNITYNAWYTDGPTFFPIGYTQCMDNHHVAGNQC